MHLEANAPPRIAFFTWEVAKEKMLTLDNLMRRGRILVDRCFLCKCNAESCNHILLWCLFSFNLWSIVYSLFGVNWVIAGSINNELWAWEGFALNNHVTRLIPLIIFWVMWKEKNNRAFEGIEDTFVNIKDRWLHYFDSTLLGHNLLSLMILELLLIYSLICKVFL